MIHRMVYIHVENMPIRADVTICDDFSRSFWCLKFLQTEIRQGTHGIICANIILNEFTHQTERRALHHARETKSLPKSTTPSQPAARP